MGELHQKLMIDINAQAEMIAKGLSTKGGLPYALAAVSEGRCPLCSGRSSETPVLDPSYDDEPSRAHYAQINCQRCLIRWRAGNNPASDLDWLSNAYMVGDGITFEATINPPSKPREDRDDWFDSDNDDEDDE